MGSGKLCTAATREARLGSRRGGKEQDRVRSATLAHRTKSNGTKQHCRAGPRSDGTSALAPRARADKRGQIHKCQCSSCGRLQYLPGKQYTVSQQPVFSSQEGGVLAAGLGRGQQHCTGNASPTKCCCKAATQWVGLHYWSMTLCGPSACAAGTAGTAGAPCATAPLLLLSSTCAELLPLRRLPPESCRSLTRFVGSQIT